ncbi:Ig-like domain-containing protein [Neobacillus sp. LXY-4]|uniref:Ig-like domain-containing protein n=1 Tax=Neobacillus sp. LXY-4 TaxID=3379826 RepID=UPI003EE0C417
MIIRASFLAFFLTMLFGSFAFAEETTISNGTPITGQITKSENHTYQFTTEEDGPAYITLDQITGDFYFKLVDIYGNTLDYDYVSPGDNTVLSDNLEKGTYYLELSPYYWDGITSASYRIKATYASTFTRNVTTFEPNDTAYTSMTIANGQYYSSKAETDIDRDVYNFTTNTDGEVYITFDSNTAEFYINLTDSNGHSVAYDFVKSGDSSYLYANVVKGTYYLSVESNYWSGVTSATYRLKATYSSSFTRNTTTYETNDTAETSMKMTSNKLYSSSSDTEIDRDVYQFTTNADGTATITLDNNTADYYINLVDSYGNSKDHAHSVSGDGTIVQAQLAKGTYYVYVDPDYWSGISSATYRIKASFIDKTPSVDPIYDTGVVLTGKAPSNTKVYAVAGSTKLGETTAKDGKYSITIKSQIAGTKIGVYTIDNAGNTSSTKYTTVVNSAIKAASSGYNKIKVSWFSVPEASGYEIYRSTSSSTTYSKVGTVTSGGTLSFTNSGVITGKTYYYKVRAYRTINGTKVYSPYTKYISGKAIPGTPVIISAKKINTYSMTLSWSKIDGATGYKVYRSTSKTGTYSLVGTVTSGSTTSFTNKSMKAGTYYYKVVAYRVVDGKYVYGNYSTVIAYRH